MGLRSHVTRTWRGGLITALGVFTMSHTGVALPASDEESFTTARDAAMSTMTRNMDVKPSGNVDDDFAASMQAQNQAAIEQAQAELRYGHNEQLRHIAQAIVVQRQQEIAAMRDAVNQASARPGAPASQAEPEHFEVPHRNPKMYGPPGS